MEYLDAYLLEEKERRPALLPEFGRPGRFADSDGEVEVAFVLLPLRWAKSPQKLEKRLVRLFRRHPPAGMVWYEDRLREKLSETAPFAKSMPGLFWMARFYREQPFRENLIVLLPEFQEEEPGRLLARQTAWLQEFLGEDYGRLNGLLLVTDAVSWREGSRALTEAHAYYRHIYRDTGLPVIGAAGLPEYFRGKPPERTACVDARAEGEAPFRFLPPETLYLDMASDVERERLLYAKRRDVCYRSARMYLDTFVRKRYNTNRCK